MSYVYHVCMAATEAKKKDTGSPAAAVAGCFEPPCDANQTQVLFSTEPSPPAADVCSLPRWHLSSFCKHTS